MSNKISDVELEQVSGGIAQFYVAVVVLGVTLWGTAVAAYGSGSSATPSGPTGIKRGST